MVRLNPLLLNKLSHLKRIQIVGISLDDCGKNEIQVLKTIVSQCKERIEKCDILIDSQKENVLSPLILPNAKYVTFRDMYFYRIWTNKCQTLHVQFAPTCMI